MISDDRKWILNIPEGLHPGDVTTLTFANVSIEIDVNLLYGNNSIRAQYGLDPLPNA